MPQSSFDRIANLINEASLTLSTSVKVTNLLQVKELLIHRESSLLDSFFEEVVKFQHDPNSEVKKAVIGFIEEACRVDTGLLKRAVGSLFYIFSTAIQQEPPSISLLKRLMSSMIPIYRTALSCAVKIGIIDSGVAIGSGIGITANSTADIALETFRTLAELKDELVRLMLPMEVSGTSIFGQYHSSVVHNDVIRIQAIRLIESVIILHSRRLPNSEIPRANEGDISLDQIPALTNTQLQSILEASTAASSATLLPGVCLVRPHRLAEEAERLFAGLSSWPVRGKPSVTPGSVTCPVVEAVMDSLVNIAKQRPQFMDRVVQAFETVHENIENGEAINDNQHLCELSNHVVNNTVSNNSQTSSICETLTPSTSTSEEAWKPLNQKHKLRSIESLCEVMLLDGIPTPFTNENTDCVACKLRNHVQTETVIRMVCAACPEFPRLCSAQCFRWWHNVHLPALRNKPRTIIESEQTGTTTKKSNNQVMVSEFQVLDQSSELKAPEKSVPQPCTASVRRLVGKRKRRKRFLYSNAKRKVIPVWPKSKSRRPPKKTLC
ncbi:unnamed protein product [Trichobilharzia szidati]|nr:unnamed protein product [Trichobilharzia szidati]